MSSLNDVSGATDRYVYYKGNYKYQLAKPYIASVLELENHSPAHIRSDGGFAFVSLQPDGSLLINEGYAWDGASGPARDTNNIMRASLVHDALYQLGRAGKLNYSRRKAADQAFHRICLEDGMSRFRAWYVYRAVRMFAAKSFTDPSTRPLQEAP